MAFSSSRRRFGRFIDEGALDYMPKIYERVNRRSLRQKLPFRWLVGASCAVCILLVMTSMMRQGPSAARQTQTRRTMSVYESKEYEELGRNEPKILVNHPESIVFARHASQSSVAMPPSKLAYPLGHNRNGLMFHSIPKDSDIFARRIDVNSRQNYEEELRNRIENQDKIEYYLEPDTLTTEDTEADSDKPCRETPVKKAKQFPACNQVHELTLGRLPGSYDHDGYHITQIGSGSYRQAWLYNGTEANVHLSAQDEDFVIRRIRYIDELKMGPSDLNLIGKDALVMERLSASPHIVDIYGFCATTILSETMPGGISSKIVQAQGKATIEEIKAENELAVRPRNNYTVSEKLNLSLQMAQAIASMNGYSEGVIVHGDIHQDQWLLSKDGKTLKLSDFNLVEILDYNFKKNRYCKQYRDFRLMHGAPEEYQGYVDESIDMFSFGNMMYALLTGTHPLYHINDYDEGQSLLKEGVRSFIDPRYRKRSTGESILVDLIARAWKHTPKDRITIFEASKILRSAVDADQRTSRSL